MAFPADLSRLPARRPDAHKGDFGRALLIGGARGMTGAITLSGMAALRGGAGLVRLAVADVCQDVVAGYEPSYMTVALPSDDEGRIALAAQEQIEKLAGEATAIGLGPGLGRSDDLTQLVCSLYRQIELPMIVDADALNALATRPEVLRQAGGPRILTPHPGEFARLVDEQLDDAPRRERAIELARECGIVIVLKGHRTLVTDGTRSAENTTGNPGMATGGMGDILTGLTTALVCQHLPVWEAAKLAVHLHGRAADLAVEDLGEVALIASDLIDYLPAALCEVVSAAD